MNWEKKIVFGDLKSKNGDKGTQFFMEKALNHLRKDYPNFTSNKLTWTDCCYHFKVFFDNIAPIYCR